jgi:hypothetical protein
MAAEQRSADSLWIVGSAILDSSCSSLLVWSPAADVYVVVVANIGYTCHV